MKSPLITLLTDFGLRDHYVAAMKGVILGISPGARIVDISHQVAPYSIAEAAYTLSQAWRCFPKGTTHIAVVDPGVGSSRRAIAVDAEGHRFITPDNGLPSLILDSVRGYKVREITASRYFRQPVSNTFHGRDIFAPVAAHLANGLVFSKLGEALSDPVIGTFAKPIPNGVNKWLGTILHIDSFGNIITNFSESEFVRMEHKPFKLGIHKGVIKHFSRSYASSVPGQLFALWGSSGYLEVSINQSNAAFALGAVTGSAVSLRI